ncbi:MAG: LPS export ABC transporter periplasmic protein LptC [Pseudomonadota bacterium]
MKINLTQIVVALLLGATIAGTLWLRDSADTGPAASEAAAGDSDYQIQQFKARIYDEQGVLSQTLRGDALIHYPREQRYTIEQPRGASYAPGGEQQRWRIRSEHAEASDDLEELIWQDEVVLSQTEGGGWVLNTPWLQQHSRRQTAYSDRGVDLVNGASTGSGREMTLDLREEQFTLRGEVESRYEQSH